MSETQYNFTNSRLIVGMTLGKNSNRQQKVGIQNQILKGRQYIFYFIAVKSNSKKNVMSAIFREV